MQKRSKVAILVNPKLVEAAALIERAFKQKLSLVIVGNCDVYYTGRARSTLEIGERILIIKEDGSLLVHRPVGYEPVNWQPSGSIFHLKLKTKKLEINSLRRKPRESVKITFDKIFMVSTLSLEDSGEFSLFASEQDMHKAILLEPSLLEDGFKPISYEKKVEPGFVDVYGMDKEGNLVVVEVKRKTARKGDVLQLAKYKEAIKNKTSRGLRGILVAPSLGKNVQRLLFSLGLEFKALDPKKCAEVITKSSTAKLESFFELDK